MSEVLALSQRPRRLSQLIGQKSITSSLKALIAANRVPRCFLFEGQSGGGKTTLARIIALSFQCKHEEFGEPCDDCYKGKAEFQIREINASEISGVNEIFDVVQNSSHAPLPPTRKRVYILDEAQRLSSAAQNLLLKHFEDAPKTTVWIICTTEPTKILPTLRRRCMQYKVKPLSHEGVTVLVHRVSEKTGIKVKVTEFVEEIMEAGIRSPSLILTALDKHASGMSIKESVIGVASELSTIGICRAVVTGELAILHEEMKKITADETRHVRAAVCGYLNAILVKSTKSEELLTDGILKLAEVGRMEEFLHLPCTNAILHKLCTAFKKR